MALQLNYYYEQFDLTFTDSYWKINPDMGITGGKNKIDYSIEAFSNKTYANTKRPENIGTKTGSFVPDITENAKNFIEQAYLHVKTLPEFDGAIDV